MDLARDDQSTPPLPEPLSLDEQRLQARQTPATAMDHAAAAAADDNEHVLKWFMELPQNVTEASESDELPLHLTELPTDWLAEEPPSAIVCCVCMNIVWEPPNLEVCGQLTHANQGITGSKVGVDPL
jgi:hypothetical protein